MFSKSTIATVGAASAVCFVGYCVYFDYKRRKDPQYKQKVRERRRKQKAQEDAKRNEKDGIPNLTDPRAIQKFFEDEIRQGEECLNAGDIEECVNHFARACSVCGQPQHLIATLQHALPPQVFQLLIHKLSSMAQSRSPPKPPGPTFSTLEEEDPE